MLIVVLQMLFVFSDTFTCAQCRTDMISDVKKTIQSLKEVRMSCTDGLACSPFLLFQFVMELLRM
jgi:hypothetical protein